jgi:hypothetical protein
MERFRKAGGTIDVTERYNKFSGRRHDLFGYADLEGLLPLPNGNVAVFHIQACHGRDVSKRRAKIEAAPAALLAVRAGIRVEIWGWEVRDYRVGRRRVVLRRERYLPAAAFPAIARLAEDDPRSSSTSWVRSGPLKSK